MSRLVAVIAVLLLLWGARCNTYDSSLLEAGVPETTAAGDTGGASGNSDGSLSNSDSGATSIGGGSPEATSGVTTTDGAGGSGGSSAEGGSGGGAAGADGTPSAATETTGGGNGGNGGASGNGGSSGSGSGTTGSAGNGGSGGCGAADCCPDSPDKLAPGQCGCDTPDTDTDADGTADCVDLCPEDAVKTEPGECGCGLRDDDTSGGVGCLGLKNGLAHRYSFSGEGTEALDAQGEASAEVVGTALDGSGAVSLAAGDVAQYVDVPPGLVSALANASLEAWFTWDGGPLWVRLIDFGSTVEATGEPGTGESFITMTPNGASGPSFPYAAFNPSGTDAEVACSGTGALTTGVLHHVAITLDTQNDALTLYLDGMLACAKALPFELAVIDDVNCWLGRSQFATDVGFSGSIDEFRIYDVALTASQVAFSFQAGPDPAFL